MDKRKVIFWQRDKKHKFEGKVIDEVSVNEEFSHGDYSKKIQLIEEKGGGTVIRFAYYVKPHGSSPAKYHFVSQNTLMVSPENANKLFNEAKKKGFF
jgi:hypothetical protein